ncbi:chitinase-3-like protein isoform X2 [Haematobia irritans]|uniref:chitinase-3-like protein isoform X2 n=1 Tax=Haematobia irritans TaxID=7368 RepID=UPI003F5062D9
MASYVLIEETKNKSPYSWQILLSVLFIIFCGVVYLVISLEQSSHGFPKCLPIHHVNPFFVNRAISYSEAFHIQNTKSPIRLKQKDSNLQIYNKHSAKDNKTRKLIICYYSTPDSNEVYVNLNLTEADVSLCTHINVGMSYVFNNTIALTENITKILDHDVPLLKEKNPSLKILLWIGGGITASDGFSEMVKNHKNRKLFINSLKSILNTHKLDGCDLDWEFPSAYNHERMHFSQLLYEIRQEYRRENKPYLLSLAVAAPEGIALFAYDVTEINKYADYVNLMTYDYHFFTKGINAPLYARKNEQSILATLNINYSVTWWIENGLSPNKIAVGLPTYGHSFRLVNPFNTKIGAPALDVGDTGVQGFVAAGETCWFLQNNILSSLKYDNVTCSPYVSSGSEWISFENELSMTCKANYVQAMGLGGVMIFSLNTDDFCGFCNKGKFPLLRTIYNVLQK